MIVDDLVKFGFVYLYTGFSTRNGESIQKYKFNNLEYGYILFSLFPTAFEEYGEIESISKEDINTPDNLGAYREAADLPDGIMSNIYIESIEEINWIIKLLNGKVKNNKE